MPGPQVTIVVTQRDRFCVGRESLDSIYGNTRRPFKLIYVDGNSPEDVRDYLEEEAERKGFSLVRKDYFLYPNEARNLGLAAVDTKFLVFLDNDVVVSPNWLEPLVRCAEETGAAVVAPLICIGKPLHENIHNGGGRTFITEACNGETTTRSFSNKDNHGGTRYQGKVSDLRGELQRGSWDYVEFHCMLVRREALAGDWTLDEGMQSTREHIDFCMTVREGGGKVYMEPESIVTFLPGPPGWADLEFFMLRWSDKRHHASIMRFGEKWGFDEVEYKKPGFRRNLAYLDPFIEKIPILSRSTVLKKMIRIPLRFLDRRMIAFLMMRNDKKREQHKHGTGGVTQRVSAS